jgi:hypothetical protein
VSSEPEYLTEGLKKRAAPSGITAKEDGSSMMGCNGEQLEPHVLGKRAVVGKLDGSVLSWDGGGLLLGEGKAGCTLSSGSPRSLPIAATPTPLSIACATCETVGVWAGPRVRGRQRP